MADVKISALPASTTPLAGTEVVPIVQSGVTKKVPVSDLTAGRSVSGTSFVPTGATVPTNGIFLGAANSVSIATNSTEHWMVNASGNLNPVGSKGIGTSLAAVNSIYATDATLTTGNLVIGTSGKGIDFSVTANSSGTMTSELLNDYEEGTWTPADGSIAGLIFTNPEGRYTKIGRMVCASLNVTFPTTVDTDYVSITLPFNFVALSRQTFGGFITYTDYGTPCYANGISNTNKINLYTFTSSILRNNGASGKTFRIALVYETL